jgi:hypothetical protein
MRSLIDNPSGMGAQAAALPSCASQSILPQRAGCRVQRASVSDLLKFKPAVEIEQDFTRP